MPQSISSTDGIPYVILSPVRQQDGLCTYEKFERVHSCSRRGAEQRRVGEKKVVERDGIG